jgi:PST family polysaccharide transporter
MSSLLNSARWVGISQASKIGFQLISMVVLARILPPSDYGVMAMASVVTALAGMLREMGTGTAVIQKKNLTDRTTSTVFWLNMGMGTLIGLVLWLFSPLISTFFKEPQLQGVLIALAALFPITSATTVHQALIERRSEFKTLTIMDVMSQGIGLALAIIAALNGAGVYSFVIPSVSSAIISSVWLWSKSGWRPKWLWCNREFKELIGFTGNLTAFNFINYFSRNADSIIIGRIMGAVSLGTYSMAYKLMLFPVQNLSWVVGRVMLPALSRLQDNKPEARALYFKSLALVVTLTAPMMVGLWVLREPFVQLAFGPKWVMVISLLAWLAPVGLIQSAVSTTGTVFTAYGRTDLMFRLGTFSTVLNVFGFWLGAQFGLVELAAIYFINNFLNAFVCGYFTLRTLEATRSELFAALKAPILSATLMGVFTYLIVLLIPSSYSALIITVIVSLVGGLIYIFVFTKVFHQSLKPLMRLARGDR